ncbi:MAG: YjgN family protein [Pseudomonadota bacterium]|nr:YjgN family protein [Pseudomonadota bacterium]
MQADKKEVSYIDAHPLVFTGRGGEYFRVWIVNVLLSLVTLGLYTPFARRRTAQYFYGHTLVADSPLEFTAQPRKMFFGFLLLVVMYSGFKLAANSGNDVAVNIFLIAGALLAPYLWASAMRFRLGSTRWRGVRLQFSAPWGEVYLASWPIFALALVWIGLITALALLVPALRGGAARMATAVPTPGSAIWMALGMGLLALTLSLLCIIRLSFNYQGLLVRRAAIGTQAGRWKPVFGDFVRIWLATAGLFLLVVILGGVLMAAVTSMAVLSLPKADGPMKFALIAVLFLVTLLGFFLALAPVRAYREARMFKLVWSNVGVSSIARFKCRLRPRNYVLLRAKNIVLTLLTLGLYRPFARVSEYAMKIDSVTLHLKGGVDQLAGQLVAQQGALGDALADGVGLELIG